MRRFFSVKRLACHAAAIMASVGLLLNPNVAKAIMRVTDF
jgi:hypothetical protein